MPHYKLVSSRLCPFVQRSAITLLEKGTPFDLEYVDLANKPQWFLEISPFGKVPLLIVDHEVVLFESAVINEYLDETGGGRRLQPEDPLRRAQNRMWIELGSSLLADQYRCGIAGTEDEARTQLAALHEKIGRLEVELGRHGGPFFNGTELSLVDTSVAPLLQRARWIADLVPGFDPIEGHPRARAWQDALLARESVRRSVVENIVELFVTFVRRPLPSLGDRPSWLGSVI